MHTANPIRPKPQIRLAGLEDIELIAKLKLKMFEDADKLHLLADDVQQLISKDYHKLYRKGEAQHFLIDSRTKTVAMAGAFIKNDLPYRYYKQSNYSFIGDVYSHPVFRRNGLAFLLTRRAIEWFEHRGVASIRLLASEEAKGLYRQLGFSETDEMIYQIKA